MNFSEAMVELRWGKNLRRSAWQNDLYMQLDDSRCVKFYQMNVFYYPFNESIILSEDWCLLSPDGMTQTQLPFDEMIKSLSKGSRAHLPEWKEEWIELDVPTKQIVQKAYWDVKGNLVYEDFISEDWQIKE